MGCFAMTETGHGSNVQALGTVATYDAGDAGVRDHHARRPTRARTTSATPRGTPSSRSCSPSSRSAAPVTGRARVRRPAAPGRRRCSPASRIEDDGLKMGLNGVDNGRIWFDGVRVPRDNAAQPVRRRHAGRASTRATSRTRTAASSPCSARSSRAGSASAAPASTRPRSRWPSRSGTATGAASSRRPTEAEEELLLDYGMHQRRLFPLLARTYALHFAQEVVADQLHDVFSGIEADDEERAVASSSRAPPAPRRSAPGTRPAPSRSAARPAAAPGYLAANRFAALKADTDVFTTFEGDNHVLLQLVAKGLLTDYASEFEDLDQFGMVRFVAGLAVETVIEKTTRAQADRADPRRAAGRRRVGPGGRAARPELPARMMLRFREEHMLAGVARRLKRGIDNGHEPGRGVLPGAGPRHRAPPARTSSGWCSRRSSTRSRPCRTATSRSRSTCSATCYALSTIEADRAWFMEHGRLSTTRSKAISREINGLCRKIRPLAVDLVDAFGVPRGDAAVRRSCSGASEPDPGSAAGAPTRSGGRSTTGRSSTRTAGGALWRAGHRAATCGCSTPPPTRSAGSRPGRGSSTSRAVAGSRCAGCGPARGLATSPPTSRSGCSTAPRRAAARARRRRPGATGAGRRRRAAVRGRRRSTWSSPSPACTASPTRPARSLEMGRVLQARRRAHRQRAAQRHRPALRADAPGRPGSPACSVRPATTGDVRRWLAEAGLVDVTVVTSGAMGYFRGVRG